MFNYYNEHATQYFNNTINLNMHHIYMDFFVLLLHYYFCIPNTEKGTILDVGCGSGRDSKYFKSIGYNVKAIDNSEHMVQLAKQHNNKLDIQLQDVTTIDYVDEFVGVWACASLLHLNDIDLKHTLNLIVKSLKVNGILYMSFKYGTFIGYRNQRFYHDFTQITMNNLLLSFPTLELIKYQITNDVRTDKAQNCKWLNCYLRKIK